MFWILAVDTSAPGGAVALVANDAVVVERAGDPAVSHGERLPAAIDAVLADAGLTAAALDLMAVAAGPGAFTGLRVGLATIQGLALALDRPAVGVGCLPALAWRHFEVDAHADACGVWLDGARGDVFAAAFRRADATASTWPPVEIAAPVVVPPEVALAGWREVLAGGAPLVLGPGAARHAAAAGDRPATVADQPLAGTVGRIGGRLHAAGAAGPPHALIPIYVRRPDAEVERDRRRAAGASTR
ncbi:MAG: tRNA (adenosine(37)-N6)-threonylcarbamoyltransferase complex dimerization subunit type 1 TsaB [Vicinamibacterales bacterium]